MKHLVLYAGSMLAVILVLTGGYILLHNNNDRTEGGSQLAAGLGLINANDMELLSSAFRSNTSIPKEYTCDGEDKNPPLDITGVPEEALSLALIAYDPDVPTDLKADGNWDHWVVWNIPKDTQRIYSGETVSGVYGSNSGGKNEYQGPCPPDREHRYFFKLYALDTMLDLPEGATRNELEGAMNGHIVGEAELIGRYDRSQ